MRRFVWVEGLLNGRRFGRQIIILCVSWYASFKLSFRDLVIMKADRISLTHTTILCWVQHYLPEFEKRWNRYARPVGGVEALFTGRHFDGQIIILCVSWYTSFKLSLRDLVIITADRGISLTHTTIMSWVQHYLPEFEKLLESICSPGGRIVENGLENPLEPR